MARGLGAHPYNKDGVKGLAQGFNKAGMAVVGQDCRGRYASQGDYVPFRTDREDGYDTIEWIAAQPWCSGKVGMWGGSALGITTNLAASTNPPHLVAGFVIVAPASWRTEILFPGGVWLKNLVDGWMDAQNSRDVRVEWSRRAPSDPYFDWQEIPRYYNNINVPIYNIGGWFDIFATGSVKNFVGLQTQGAPGARGNQKLLMAAAGHGPITPRWKEYPNGGGNTGAADPIRWFSYWLKGEQNGVMSEPPIRYFVMGDAENPFAPGNEWRTADKWPPAEFTPTSYYLNAGGGLSTTTPASEGPSKSEYAYDPADPVKSVGGANLILARGPLDQREIGECQDYLRFNSAPLDAPVQILGSVTVDLNVQTDAPDTDFMAKLVDVYPDGYEALLSDLGQRLRYRHGLDKEAPMTPDEIAPITIDLGPTAYIFDRGHRIAVHVSSSNAPRFDPNPNTGKPLRTDDETRVAHNALYHDAAHPSRVTLPVVPLGPRPAPVKRVLDKLFPKSHE